MYLAPDVIYETADGTQATAEQLGFSAPVSLLGAFIVKKKRADDGPRWAGTKKPLSWPSLCPSAYQKRFFFFSLGKGGGQGGARGGGR